MRNRRQKQLAARRGDSSGGSSRQSSYSGLSFDKVRRALVVWRVLVLGGGVGRWCGAVVLGDTLLTAPRSRQVQNFGSSGVIGFLKEQQEQQERAGR